MPKSQSINVHLLCLNNACYATLGCRDRILSQINPNSVLPTPADTKIRDLCTEHPSTIHAKIREIIPQDLESLLDFLGLKPFRNISHILSFHVADIVVSRCTRKET